MYRISPKFYSEMVEMLLGLIDQKEYFSGSFEFEFECVSCRVLLSAVIYRRDSLWPEGERREVTDMVPVWWELHTEIDGREVLNDFSFNELREYIKEQ